MSRSLRVCEYGDERKFLLVNGTVDQLWPRLFDTAGEAWAQLDLYERQDWDAIMPDHDCDGEPVYGFVHDHEFTGPVGYYVPVCPKCRLILGPYDLESIPFNREEGGKPMTWDEEWESKTVAERWATASSKDS